MRNYDKIVNQTLEDVYDSAISEAKTIRELDLLDEAESRNKDRNTFYIWTDEIRKKILTEELGIIQCDVLKKLIDIPRYDDTKEKEEFSESVKEQIMERDNHTYQLCLGARMEPVLNAHHIIPNSSGDINNGIILCSKCHNLVHTLLRELGYKYYIR